MPLISTINETHKVSSLNDLKSIYPELNDLQLLKVLDSSGAGDDQLESCSTISADSGLYTDKVPAEQELISRASLSKYSTDVDLGALSSSGDEEFEDFLIKSKTPVARCRPLNINGDADFIVDDDELRSSEEENSPTFYRQTLNGRAFRCLQPSDTERNFVRHDETHERNEASTASVSHLYKSFSADNLNRRLDFENVQPDSRVITQPCEVAYSPALKCGRIKTFSTKNASILQNDAEFEEAVRFLSNLCVPNQYRNLKRHRVDLTQKLFELFNKYVFNNKLPGNINISWNNRLTRTAGQCYYQFKDNARSVRIELSDKVADTPERIRDTLVHEMCHAAVWLLDGEKGGHGRAWKMWAAKANHTFRHLPRINRCHSYEISAKFVYRCTMCNYQISRHSKSLDTDKKLCGLCKGHFVLMQNEKLSDLLGQPPKTPKFALFVKENYSSVRKDIGPSSTHKDVMHSLSSKFKSLQLPDDHDSPPSSDHLSATKFLSD